MTFQNLIFALQQFWADRGCVICHPYDVEKGAGTMSPHTFLRVLGPTPWNVAYVEPSRRPTDGRYADNPNRLQHYFQFQVILKPSPLAVQTLYLDSLKAIGIDPTENDIRFVEDNWESPTLGAWGVGWEVWLNGMEITQFTYFQQCGGIDLQPISVEITYGLERLAMLIQKVPSVFDIIWNKSGDHTVTYGDIYRAFEIDQCHYNFQLADTNRLTRLFDEYEAESIAILTAEKVHPAYDLCLKCSHIFNLLDARGAIGVTERTVLILRIRKLARDCAKLYTSHEESQ